VVVVRVSAGSRIVTSSYRQTGSEAHPTFCQMLIIGVCILLRVILTVNNNTLSIVAKQKVLLFTVLSNGSLPGSKAAGA
jgi:hypothetical protein